MDYKTNQLGTCKHIEAVRLWLENHGRKIQAVNPPYSSLYVSYRDGRKIFLRIGSAHWDEMGTLAKKYFTKDLELIENTIPSIQKFIRRASIDPDIAARIAPDIGGGIQDFTEAPQNLAELQNIMIRAEQIWDEVPKEIKLKFDNDVDKFIASFGTVEWAKNLGIYQEERTEAGATEATEATEAKQ